MSHDAAHRDARIRDIARAVAAAGGRALLVGGAVRDQLMGRAGRDVDVEVLGLTLEVFESVLSRFGRTYRMGRSYTVLRLRDLEVDFTVDDRFGCDFAAASLRRDLTINSMAIDPLSGDILDPHGGRSDIAAGRLRATHPASFGDDPLRALRVARFAACLGMQPDASLCEACARLDLDGVAGERMLVEVQRLLVEAERPAEGFAVLERCHQLRAFPELAALVGVAQDPEWHPEGDVWTHTKMVLDAAARLRRRDGDDLALMFGALCHDLGKPATTERDGHRIRSLGHDRAGIAPTTALLTRLRAPNELIARVCALVEHHLAPALFVKGEAGPRGYRRLARKLDRVGASLDLLVRVARADHLGRTTEDAMAGSFSAGDAFLERAAQLEVAEHGPPDVVTGRDVIGRGVAPGPRVGVVLRRCRAIQDERGETDAARILDEVLGQTP